ncbi:MAG: hypothetical protein ACI8Q1_003123 [Parvicella sp.]|jgi:hypothetical protein
MSKSPKHSEFKDQLGDLNLTPPASGWDGVVGAVANSVGEFSAIAEISSLPPAHIWPEIAAVLAPNRKRRIAYWWWSGAAAAVLIGVLFTFDFSDKELEYSMERWSEPSSVGFIASDNSIIKEETEIENKEINVNVTLAEIEVASIESLVDKSIKGSSVKNKRPYNNSYQPDEGLQLASSGCMTKIDTGFGGAIRTGLCFLEPIAIRVIPLSAGNHLPIRPIGINCGQPPAPYVKEKKEILLAANLGATSKSSNMNYGNLESFASSADASIQSGIVASSLNSTHNVNAEVIDYSQSLPVSFGLDVRQTFGGSWFLSSGIIYSGTAGLLSYTVNSKEESLKVRDHYVGIPISIGVHFLDKRKFHLFSSISHLNEALLVRTEINSFPEINKSSSFLLRPQLGLGAQFGILFKLKNNWGVSAAISAKSYYLAPDNSYWKSQRLWPALNVSVVYNFTKKELFL